MYAGTDFRRADRSDNTPLLMAARAGHAPMTDYLLALCADIEVRNEDDRTAVYQAVAGGHAAIVRQLLAHGANPNAESAGTTPIAVALDHDPAEIVDLLVANDANDASGYARPAAAAAVGRG